MKILVAIAALAVSAAAHSQPYPTKPVRFISGVTPEMKRTVLLGNACAATALDTHRRIKPKSFLIAPPYIFCSPNCPASQSAVRLR